jgi:hypothetical protein
MRSRIVVVDTLWLMHMTCNLNWFVSVIIRLLLS